jgi:hypothetical protein
MILSFPLKGKFLGLQSSKQPNQTSRDLNNVRPFFDGRAVGGQRPGMDKVYTQQIGGQAAPIVTMCSVTVVD